MRKDQEIKQSRFIGRKIGAAVLCAALMLPAAAPCASAKITVSIEDPKPGEGIQEAHLGTSKATGISVKKKLTVKKGKKKTLKVKVKPAGASQQVTYKSSNRNVAKVTKKGVVKGIRKGKAKITIRTTDGTNKKKTVTVTVR